MRSRSVVPYALAILGVVVVLALALAVGAGVTDPFDAAVIDVVRAEALRDLLSPLRWVTELGSTAAVTIIAGIVLVLGIVLDERREGVIGAITILLASIANSLLKLTVARARPDLLDPIVQEHGYSFPSGHSMLSMVSYGIVAVVIARSALPVAVRIGIIAGLAGLIGLIGLSRVWLGVHYPTDVIAGWTAGAVVVLVYAEISRRVSRAPGAAGAAGDRAAPRSDRPVTG